MKEYVARKCAPKTAEAYSQWGQYAIAKFGDMRLQDLPAKPLVIEIALNELLDNGGRIDRKNTMGIQKGHQVEAHRNESTPDIRKC